MHIKPTVLITIVLWNKGIWKNIDIIQYLTVNNEITFIDIIKTKWKVKTIEVYFVLQKFGNSDTKWVSFFSVYELEKIIQEKKRFVFRVGNYLKK